MDLRELFDAQAGVVARRQLVEAGLSDNDLRRLVRQRRLVRVHPGVYVNHTGPLSWVNRAWAAVLFHGDAALCDVSALHAAGDPIHVAVEHPRRGACLPGVRLQRMVDLRRRVLWNAAPPRLRVEEAALDAASGVQSILERRYVHDVERRHGLPTGRRQVRAVTSDGVVYRDVAYEDQGVVVELDGYRWHEDGATRSADLDRDLGAAADGVLTLRVGWRQVERHPCRTAARIAQVLAQRGWSGRPRPCGPRCALSGRSRSPGACRDLERRSLRRHDAAVLRRC